MEYELFWIDNYRDEAAAISALNEMAADGWRVDKLIPPGPDEGMQLGFLLARARP